MSRTAKSAAETVGSTITVDALSGLFKRGEIMCKVLFSICLCFLLIPSIAFAQTIEKVVIAGPDIVEPMMVEVGLGTPTIYIFQINYTGDGATPVVVLDTVPAEWNVSVLEDTDPTDADGIVVSTANKKDNEKSATKIVWVPPISGPSTITVMAVSRGRPKGKDKAPTKYAPTSCGLLYLNDGAEVYELDLITGEPKVDPTTGIRLAAIVSTVPLRLAAVMDLNGGGIVGDGTGDEDGDGYTDADEVFNLESSPCDCTDPDAEGCPPE